MAKTSKEERAKIRRLEQELLQNKKYYSEKIRNLVETESRLRGQAANVNLLTPKLIKKQEEKTQEIKKEIEETERERDKKIEKIEREITIAKDNYKNNHDEYKKEDKRVRNRKIKDMKMLFHHYRFAFAGLLIIILVIIIFSIVSIISKKIEITNERNRNYYVDIDENFTFDCNAKYDGGFSAYCEDRFISGQYSHYDTVEFTWTVSLTTNGNSFTQKLYDYVEPSSYKRKDFNIEDLKNGMDKSYTFSLKNKVLNEIVANKTVKIHYNFSEADLNIISQLHDKWVSEETEKEAKAQQEAEEKARKEAEKEAEDKARKEAEEKAAEEEAKKKATESGDNPYQIPENEISTAIVVCKRVLKNAYGIDVKTTDYSSGNWSGRDYEWILAFRYGKNYTLATCGYNWKTGAGTAKYINW